MAASDLVDICSHLQTDDEFDFYPILSHIHDESWIHTSIKGVEKYDIYGILVNLGILKLQTKGLVVVKKKMDQLSSLLDITSKNLLQVQVNNRKEVVDGKQVKVYSIVVKENTLSTANVNLRNCRNHHNAYFRLCRKATTKKSINQEEDKLPRGNAASMTRTKDLNDKSSVLPDKSQATSTGEFPHKYSLLTSVLLDGEQSNLTDCITPTLQQSINVGVKLNQLLQEIEDFTKEHNAIVDRNNGTYAKMYFIPRFTNKKSFDNWEHDTNTIHDLLKFMSKGKHNIHGHPIAAEYIAHLLLKSFKSTMLDSIGTASPRNMTVMERMTAVETAALLSDTGIPDSVLFTQFQRHIRSKSLTKQFCLFTSRNDMNELIVDKVPHVGYSQYEYEKEEGKKKENVEIAAINIEEYMTLDIGRYVKDKIESARGSQIFPAYTPMSGPLDILPPMFGYKTKSAECGTYVLLGTDHGAGHSQCALRINLASSLDRRNKFHAEYGTRVIPYNIIKCRKDVTEILRLTAAETNRGLTLLRQNQLVAVRDEKKSVFTCFVAKGMTKYRIIRLGNRQKQLLVSNNRNTTSKIVPLPMTMGDLLQIRVVVKAFHILQVGDLAAQVATQGREHMSSCRCFKCNLTIAQWKAGRIGEILTLMDFCNFPNTDIGQKYRIVWNIGGDDSLTPVLHCQIGTGNYQIFVMLAQLMIRIDSQTNEEYNKRTEILTLLSTIREDKERLIALKSSYELRNSTLKTNIREMKQFLSQSKKRRAQVQKSNQTDRNDCILREDYNIAGYEHRLTELQTTIETMKKHEDESESALRQKNSNLATLQKDVKTCVEKRKKGVNGLDTTLERILTKYGASIQAYHGGTMHGKDIVKICQNWKGVMDDVESACFDILEKRNREYLLNQNTSRPPPSFEEVRTKLDLHRKLLQSQDAVYSHLRIIAPTTEEKLMTRQAIALMKKYWLELECSVTHKAHIIFTHAADDQEEFDGLGDKGEDDWERRHQTQGKFDHMLKRMSGGWGKQIRTQLKYEWRNNHPCVLRQVEKVYNTTSRKRKIEPGTETISLREKRQATVKAERVATRQTFVATNLPTVH